MFLIADNLFCRSVSRDTPSFTFLLEFCSLFSLISSPSLYYQPRKFWYVFTFSYLHASSKYIVPLLITFLYLFSSFTCIFLYVNSTLYLCVHFLYLYTFFKCIVPLLIYFLVYSSFTYKLFFYVNRSSLTSFFTCKSSSTYILPLRLYFIYLHTFLRV